MRGEVSSDFFDLLRLNFGTGTSGTFVISRGDTGLAPGGFCRPRLGLPWLLCRIFGFGLTCRFFGFFRLASFVCRFFRLLSRLLCRLAFGFLFGCRLAFGFLPFSTFPGADP
jgi:hypothetical protein